MPLKQKPEVKSAVAASADDESSSGGSGKDPKSPARTASPAANHAATTAEPVTPMAQAVAEMVTSSAAVHGDGAGGATGGAGMSESDTALAGHVTSDKHDAAAAPTALSKSATVAVRRDMFLFNLFVNILYKVIFN